jgi:hypothetical protein
MEVLASIPRYLRVNVAATLTPNSSGPWLQVSEPDQQTDTDGVLIRVTITLIPFVHSLPFLIYTHSFAWSCFNASLSSPSTDKLQLKTLNIASHIDLIAISSRNK